MSSELCSGVRLRLLEFLIHSAHELQVRPIVKYSAFSLFADRFCHSLSKHSNDMENWLLHPMRESNLQLFALVSIWISSKMHDSHPLSVKCLKSLGDKMIKEQHFTTRDFLEAVLDFEIGTSNIAFIFLEELFIQFKGIATVGKLVNFEACMDIMDLLYEKDQTSALYNSPKYLAASILACAFTFLISNLIIQKCCTCYVFLLCNSFGSFAGCFICYHSSKTEMGISCSSLGEVCNLMQRRGYYRNCQRHSSACISALFCGVRAAFIVVAINHLPYSYIISFDKRMSFNAVSIRSHKM
ncbi:cyclin-J18 isoform X2 [Camellia sinensis]|uniref:cyclin-J18 isoform X2 n=1 Tax=Camellia sinensis TaxID=4442 RepID=UPI001035A17A|nr:cyclin-J18 isoform X2 [Camellia sinensis]